MGYDFELEGELSIVHPAHGDETSSLVIDERHLDLTLVPTRRPGEFILELNGHREAVFVASQGDVHFVHIRGRAHRVEAINALERARRAAAPSDAAELLCAPMPGVVVNVLVAEGDTVESGQLLMTIESMKLQTPIVAPHAGRVAELRLHAGSSFEHGAVLVRLETLDDVEGESK
jgi:biotin carboxyl carrier protein